MLIVFHFSKTFSLLLVFFYFEFSSFDFPLAQSVNVYTEARSFWNQFIYFSSILHNFARANTISMLQIHEILDNLELII